ncbi:tetratricopeptide repeat protein [Prevotella sp. Sow4_E9_plate]|uniref:type IX secretion system periplasmic lipoprotein PorW/SprE n=1 Tax=Prevotella sp. Sow4_E9_plate TaxID=3438802 RepID=UPI003F9DB223
MKQQNTFHYALGFVFLTTALILTGCSTQKNTAQSRWWHAFNAKYNTYYNGTLAYIDGSLEKETGNKDNYTEQIPLYTVSNKNSREIGKANFDRAIEKCEKAIHQHSIKRKPEWTKNRRKTAKDIEWLSRREYNPFLWKAWMLMGRSQFYQGDFESAAATFSYMSRLYATQPAIYGKARAWLAKCYIEQNWNYDAEDVIRNILRDSIHWRAQKEWDYTFADYYIHTGNAEQAIPYLRKVISHEMRRKQKAREWYLMGQLQASIGNKKEAYKAFRHVIRQNPPYELAFNARIAMTEVMAKDNAGKMISRLKRMAASDNNKEYQDQIYYAIGNIHLSRKDTLQAITAYEKGNQKSTRNGIEKGVLLLHLGDLYWTKEKFSDARRCYGEAIGLLDKDRKDYQQLANRSKVLDELVPYTDAVQLQDSLQQLARMSEKERNAAIDRVIDALKKKEKEERNRKAEEEAESTLRQDGGNLANNNFASSNSPQKNNENSANTPANGQWYFYSPLTVSQGKAQFQKLWGKRDNVDNWQRINKTVVANAAGAEEITDEQRDSLAQAAEQEELLKQTSDSAVNDPHRREYYLAQIPFTPEQLAESNKLLEDGLYHAGVIFKDKLDNLPLSRKSLLRLVNNHPDYAHLDDAYYHLYLLYSRERKPEMAQTYLQKLKAEYPESQWTTLLSDPYYAENAKRGVQIEDSLYTLTYQAFRDGEYDKVERNAQISRNRFPDGANRDKFLFIGGLSKLNDGDIKSCLADLKEVVSKYPDSRLSEMAGMIINGVDAGRRLYGGKFDLNDVWTRRSIELNDRDSTRQKGYSPERNASFVFLLAYDPDKTNENQLLFEMAKYNFTSYMARYFDINIEDLEGLHRMQISGFNSYDEARQYANAVYQQPAIKRLLGNVRAYVISEPNLKLLGTSHTYEEYEKFYSKHFAPLPVSKLPLLLEPAETAPAAEEEPSSEEATSEESPKAEQSQEDNTLTVPITPQDEPLSSGELEVEGKKEEIPEKKDDGILVIPNQKEKKDDGTLVIPNQKKEKKEEDTGIYFDDSNSSESIELEDEYFELEGF